MGMAIHVPIKEAKNRLSELVRMAEAGESITLTRNGKPAVEFTIPRKRCLDFGALAKWRLEKGLLETVTGLMSPDFDDPLPADFLITPHPPEFWGKKSK